MKHILDEIVVKKSLNRWEIGIKRHYIDNFGKGFTDYRNWDDFATKDLLEKAKDSELQKMRNCGYKI